MRDRFEPPSKLTLIFYAYAWIVGFIVLQLLAYPEADLLRLTEWLTGSPGVVLIVAELLDHAMPYFVIGFAFECLTEGDWKVHGAGAFLATEAVDLVWVAFASKFRLPPLRIWPHVLEAAACLAGARLAFHNLWRPGLQHARELVLSFFSMR